ncbi:MAG: DUF547 domain-containing protein, partial [Candidatus Saccharimonadales bacterium]
MTMHYPVKSIKDIDPSVQIPFVATPWEIKFFTIGCTKMDLAEIEHGILRKKFNDPLVHFSLVCASMSCPKLRNQAYIPDKRDKQLVDQVRSFISNKAKNKITPDKLLPSMILNGT